ncbi:hypothetical protein NIES3806_37370 [Microcystis aeruginosa NIES-3806]|uniref:Outer membrane efflux protein n=1 Tax=Microcystis aeruginosa NIES-3807 TaxID=2517785 RepID=A0AAD3B0Q5_MICAE|nr:hypothetical protein NIES3806_37370 [Microcystis aeruginosa NIES-3806]GCL59056.1 hypothetical protein NIES3807_22260 [Microcystis aeruginosa NIES-3807]
MTPLQAAPLPCLDSGNDCLRTLTEAAIERSPELQTLDERIALIDRRLQLAGQRIDQANARQWTGYLTTDPIAILQNIFGGGQVQQQRMAITDLEIRAADLEAARAELERQRAAKRSQLGEQVLTLVIAYETAGDRERAILAQLSNHDLLTRITEIDYRLGGSSTETYLTRIAQREQLEIQWNRYRLERETAKRQLLSLTGFSTPETPGGTTGVMGWNNCKFLWRSEARSKNCRYTLRKVLLFQLIFRNLLKAFECDK